MGVHKKLRKVEGVTARRFVFRRDVSPRGTGEVGASDESDAGE